MGKKINRSERFKLRLVNICNVDWKLTSRRYIHVFNEMEKLKEGAYSTRRNFTHLI